MQLSMHDDLPDCRGNGGGGGGGGGGNFLFTCPGVLSSCFNLSGS